jgi:hypothetical protein
LICPDGKVNVRVNPCKHQLGLVAKLGPREIAGSDLTEEGDLIRTRKHGAHYDAVRQAHHQPEYRIVVGHYSYMLSYHNRFSRKTSKQERDEARRI